jgi:hypothetical protein
MTLKVVQKSACDPEKGSIFKISKPQEHPVGEQFEDELWMDCIGRKITKINGKESQAWHYIKKD